MVDEWLACPIQGNVVRVKSTLFTLKFLNTSLNEKSSTSIWTELGFKKNFVLLDFVFGWYYFLYWVTRGNPMPKIAGLIIIGLYLSINTVNSKRMSTPVLRRSLKPFETSQNRWFWDGFGGEQGSGNN